LEETRQNSLPSGQLSGKDLQMGKRGTDNILDLFHSSLLLETTGGGFRGE
jgi:hypothetical protein